MLTAFYAKDAIQSGANELWVASSPSIVEQLITDYEIRHEQLQKQLLENSRLAKENAYLRAIGTKLSFDFKEK